MCFPTPTGAVDEEETWWYSPIRVHSPESSDVVGCVEAGGKGVRDGVVCNPLEVVEPGFLLRDLTGKGFAVVKEMGLQNVGFEVMVQRKGRNGEAMLPERVVPTANEASEIVQSSMAVVVI